MQKASTRKFHAASSQQIRQNKGLTADPQAVVLLGSPAVSLYQLRHSAEST
jgi:hypothetical protein